MENVIKVVEIYQKVSKEICISNENLSSPSKVAEFLQDYFKDFDREYGVVLGLNTKNKINLLNVVSVGSVNSAVIHPREIFKGLILSNCVNFILAHTHPSGDSKESQADISVSKRLKSCGEIIGIEMIDSIIIGQEEYTSLREKGII